MTANSKIKARLEEVGVFVNNVYDLVRSHEPYPQAIPVLLHLLQEGMENSKLKEGVIRALARKEATGKAGRPLIEEYHKIPKEKMVLRWTIGQTISRIITRDEVQDILAIIQDKTNGISRQMFVLALGKIPCDEAEDILIGLLNDADVNIQVMEVLGKLKSKKAVAAIEALIAHPNVIISKAAQKTLAKINSGS
jgi:HEAT repeat protein